MEIKESKDYSKFKTILGNRNINKQKVINISNDVVSGFNMLPYCPIVVSEKDEFLYIIDGQHRFEVSVSCDLPVYYVIYNDISLQQIASLNSKSQKWSMNDFLNCYIQIGIKDYKILKEISAKYKVQLGTVASLLMTFDVRKRIKDEFESGNFTINFQEETIKILELTDSLFGRYAFSRDRYLFGAVQAIDKAGKCDYEVLKDKINQNPVGMDKHADIKNYIYNIERVYNFKNRERQTIV